MNLKINDKEIFKHADELFLQDRGKDAVERRKKLFKSLGSTYSKSHSLNLWLMYFYWTDGLMWCRLFVNGVGFKIKNVEKHSLLFSERNKINGFKIGKYHFSKLNPVK